MGCAKRCRRKIKKASTSQTTNKKYLLLDKLGDCISCVAPTRMRFWLLVAASSASALDVSRRIAITDVSRRVAITAAGLSALPGRPLSSSAAPDVAALSSNAIVADGDCEDCRIPSAQTNASPASPKFAVGDVISLDGPLFDAPVKPAATNLFDAQRKAAASSLPNPQLEAKRAMYKLAAGEYDVGATQAKLSALIQATPVLVFSLST